MIRKILNKLANRPTEPPTLQDYTLHLIENVIQTVCGADTLCVDVGAGEGAFLRLLIQHSPQAVHYAFEPNPHLYFAVKRKLASAARIYNNAVSNTTGNGTFFNVKGHPAYSGLKPTLLHRDEEIEKATIKITSLDQFIGTEEKIGLIKIHASGAEYNVIKGAQNLIKNQKPTILFSFSQVTAQAYGVSAEQMHELFQQLGYSINVMPRFLKKESPIPFLAFKSHYIAGDEEFFIAVPQ